MKKTPKTTNSPQNLETFYIRTFGCQMNVHDSERMAQLLTGLGLRPAASEDQADLLIVNSCSVRAKPEHKALSEAGRFQAVKRQRGTKIVLAGCVAQHGGRSLIERAPYLDAVIGPGAICRLPDIVERLGRGEPGLVDTTEHRRQAPGFVPLGPEPSPRVSVPVTIMKGCDNYCSYCIVPYVRGREVSRPLADILDEVQRLSERGTREVTLLGQNVNSYRDPGGTGFVDLLAALDAQAAVDRIRFTTSHPKDSSTELARAMNSLGRVCEHLHLAMQSGSNRILQRMNRKYTREEFIRRAGMFREQVPGISLTTDLIVGFPSESESDFEDTLQAVGEVAFDQAFSFKYSPRPGTQAATFPDDVPPEVKAQRLETLQAELSRLESESLTGLTGSVQEVLVEGPSLRDPRAASGRTRCNRVVNFSTDEAPQPGRLAIVRIEEARGHTLWGKIQG